jgi:hypothetical protein
MTVDQCKNSPGESSKGERRHDASRWQAKKIDEDLFEQCWNMTRREKSLVVDGYLG